MKVTTTVLDKVAFFTTFGGEITDIAGKYPENEFTVTIPVWLSFYERIGGWVPHNAFCNQRRKLKRRTRKLAGLPEYFTGNHDTGFKLGDIAMIAPNQQIRLANKLKRMYGNGKSVVNP